MSKPSEETVTHYRQARLGDGGRLGWFLADALRDAEARAMKAEYMLQINDYDGKYPANDRGSWTFADWQQAADKKLRGDNV